MMVRRSRERCQPPSPVHFLTPTPQKLCTSGKKDIVASDPFGGTDTLDDETREAESFLNGGSSVSAKFPKEGFTVEGTVLDWTMRQQTHNETRELLYWKGKKATPESDFTPEQLRRAKPVMQCALRYQGEPTGITWESNAYVEVPVPDDDGIRTLYLFGAKATAFGEAKLKAGTKGNPAPLEKGAYFTMTRGKDRKTSGGYRAHTFTATWTPAAQNTKAAAALAAAGEDDDPFQ